MGRKQRMTSGANYSQSTRKIGSLKDLIISNWKTVVPTEKHGPCHVCQKPTHLQAKTNCGIRLLCVSCIKYRLRKGKEIEKPRRKVIAPEPARALTSPKKKVTPIKSEVEVKMNLTQKKIVTLQKPRAQTKNRRRKFLSSQEKNEDLAITRGRKNRRKAIKDGYEPSAYGLGFPYDTNIG